MKTAWMTAIVAAMLAVSFSSVLAESRPVENERQKRFDRDRDGQLNDREQAAMEEFARIGARAEELQAQAKEHEEIARKLRAESEELSRNLDRQLQARQSESPDRADSEKAAEELRQWNEGLRDQQRARMKEKSVELLEQSKKAKQQGRHEQAAQLLAESEELARRLRAPDAKPGSEEYIRDLQDRLSQLDQASGHAASAGNPARAQALRRQADQVRSNLDVANRWAEAARIRNEIRQLGQQADMAQSAGNREKAAEIRKEAAALKQRMADMEIQSRPERQRQYSLYPWDPNAGRVSPYPPAYHYPRPSPYDRRINALPRGMAEDLAFIQGQLLQLQRMYDEFYILAGEDPSY
ncbi:MAG: hypothetical protein GX455_04930 [Phycisphaerae bacterium]|nr:hypothetical protein [Phycisphaerae bacterium]